MILNSTPKIITGGGSSDSGAPGDITFYDYDGTIITSWTLEELTAKTALPDYPSHEGLICQGWNWSLADLKTTNRKMNVGAMYITDDGKTRIYIRLEEGRTSPMLGVCPNGTVTVDWGDGTTPDILTGTSTSTVQWTPNHAYATAGEYVIKLTVDGAMEFDSGYSLNSSKVGSAILRYSSGEDNRNFAYRNSVQKIEIGNNVTYIGDYVFYYCYSLASITIPNNITRIGSYAFEYCYSLASITIPNSVTSTGDTIFYYCYSLASITIPNSVKSILNYMFGYCYSLTSITIPNNITRIGNYAFGYCYSLASITIPNSVTTIGNYAFYYCYSLASITIPNSVTTIGNYAFEYCYNVASITILNGAALIGNYAFGYCYSLASITIPNGVTIPGTTAIRDSTFYNCYSLASITIPNNMISIGSYAFYNCYGVSFYDFSNYTSVLPLSSTNAFTNIPADCQIRVPTSLVDEWKAATNWSTFADHIVGV